MKGTMLQLASRPYHLWLERVKLLQSRNKAMYRELAAIALILLFREATSIVLLRRADLYSRLSASDRLDPVIRSPLNDDRIAKPDERGRSFHANGYRLVVSGAA